MTDRAAVAVAVAVIVGARIKFTVHPVVVLALVLVVLATRARPTWLACITCAALASFLGGRAWDGLTPQVTPGNQLAGVATLVADPIDIPGSTRVDLRIHGMRLRATSREANLRDAAAGERWNVQGRYSPLDETFRTRLASRHIAGRLTITRASRRDAGTALARVANSFRSVVLRGVDHLPPERRALFAGVVLGDDRGQDIAQIEDFRASGLTHILAVSGQNVVFFLALAAPILTRLRLTTRVIAGAGLLVLFGTITRWEPSVTRAIAMAGLGLVATTIGRPTTSLRILALAIGVLVLVDPLLVHSIGFALSAAACAGLTILAPVFARRMPSPLAATLAAQLAVIPVMLPLFGPVPVAAIPANLAAGPVAGPLMMWGVAAGFVAGLTGRPIAVVLHLPTQAMLAWLAGVARVAAGLPLGWVTPAVAIVATAVGAIVALLRLRRVAAVVAAVGLAAVACAPAVAPRSLEGAALDTGGDDRVWRRGGTTIVVTDGRAPPGRLLAALRRNGVAAADLIVVTRASKAAARSVLPVLQRIATGVVVAPASHQVPDAVAVETPVTLDTGTFTVDLVPGGSGLHVRIGSGHAPRARVPRLRHPDPRARHGHPQPNP